VDHRFAGGHGGRQLFHDAYGRPGVAGPRRQFYQVANITSDTTLTLASTYFGAASPAGFVTYTPLTAGKLSPVTGTTYWTNGSTTVTSAELVSGNLVNEFATLQPGQILQGPDGDLYVIANVGNNSLTLAAAFNGASTNPLGPGATVETLPPGGYGVQGYLGNDPAGSSTDPNSVNLYKFTVATQGTITINASNLAAGLGSVYLRLFDSTGTVELTNATNSLSIINSNPNTTYYLGVSSTGNTAYDAVSCAGATGGAGLAHTC